MCADIMQEIAGCLPEHRQGVLEGYSRRRVKGQVYPGLVQDEGRRVDGVVYLDLPDADWERLDRFEGRMYARRRVSIETDDEGRLTAETYIVRPEYLGRLGESEWDFQEFLRNGKSEFRAGYAGYRSIFTSQPT